MHLANFQYLPLRAPNDFRLLCIPRQTASSVCEDAVEYALCHASIENANYIALSYAWGDPAATRPITVNGQTVKITESLAVALHNLRREDEDVVLWADALCINQKDPVEMTVQVGLMRRIFSAARHVVLWLGPSTPETNCSMREIRRLGDQLVEAGIWELTRNEIFQWDTDANDQSEAAQTKRKITDMADRHLAEFSRGEIPFWWIMSDLGARSWFTRIWCIQECSNARVARFKCGSEEVDFTRFWAVALYVQVFKCRAILHNTRLSSPDDIPTARCILWMSNQLGSFFKITLLGIRRTTLLYGGHSLFTLLQKTSVSDSEINPIGASDPRDRVYALLGIANDETVKDIVADYTLSCKEAYIMAARALLKQGHDDVLSLCRKRNFCKDLPSWVPDWTATNRKPWSTWDENWMFNASAAGTTPGASSIITLDPNPLSPKITLRGTIVDKIKEVGCIRSVGIEDSWDFTVIRAYLDDIVNYVERSRYGLLEKEEAKWRLPVGDTEAQGTTHQVGRLQNVTEAKAGYEVLRMEAQDEITSVPTWRYLAQLDRIHDSRPFLSQTGYVGICPMEARPGDAIVIILGARVPYILRKGEAEEWMLVGESHVYGIMDGEFMTQDPPPTIENIILH